MRFYFELVFGNVGRAEGTPLCAIPHGPGFIPRSRVVALNRPILSDTVCGVAKHNPEGLSHGQLWSFFSILVIDLLQKLDNSVAARISSSTTAIIAPISLDK